MNNYICIGKIVNTHGIKGELRILSDFELKEKVFKVNQEVYIGKDKQKEIITSYRKHKEFDMITLKDYDNINLVLKFKNNYIYVDRSTLDDNNYLLQDLIGLEVIENNTSLGKVKDYYNNGGNTVLEVSGGKTFYIPIKGEYIKKVNTEQGIIETENAKDLII